MVASTVNWILPKSRKLALALARRCGTVVVLESVQSFGLFSRRNRVADFHKGRTFNDHPTCILCLGFTTQDFTEPVQIEVSDIVIDVPSQVDRAVPWLTSSRTLTTSAVSVMFFMRLFFGFFPYLLSDHPSLCGSKDISATI